MSENEVMVLAEPLGQAGTFIIECSGSDLMDEETIRRKIIPVIKDFIFIPFTVRRFEMTPEQQLRLELIRLLLSCQKPMPLESIQDKASRFAKWILAGDPKPPCSTDDTGLENTVV